MEPSDTLPYTLFLILAELGIGGLIVMAAVDLRGEVTRGFVKATTVMVPVVLGLATWVAFALEGDIVEGYRLDAGPRDAMVALMVVLTVGSALHVGLLYRDQERPARWLGAVLAVLAVGVLLLASVMLRLPVWGMGLIFLSLLFGTLSIGLAVVGLTLGHWYLVTPRLPARPLNEITLVFLVVVPIQIVLLVVALVVPVDETPIGGRDIPLQEDVTFWLRIVVGLVLPLIFGAMAYASSRIRSMMAATGLLYLVTALVLAGEIAARALLFDSGRPL
ncbi:MAG: hypothetical protein O6913_06335 [Chloroflexi bacterium]|nr:hypothetical protein [Chloroflexota bacterium]